MLIQKLKNMFSEVVLRKDASLIPVYYHPEFLLYTNGMETNYASFLSSHEEYYASPRMYHVEYDDQTFVEYADKVACRMWITISMPELQPKRIEVILIAQYKDDKIYRVWEVTSPDWSQLPEFKD